MKLYNEDCLEGISKYVEMGDIDVVVTSPPYNLGISYGDYDDTISRLEYLTWMGEVAKWIRWSLSPEGSLFLNMGSKPTDPMVPFEVLKVFLDAEFCLQNTLHWVKHISIGDVGYGHFKPINSQRFVNDCHEYIFHLTLGGNVALDRLGVGVPYTDKSNISRWSGGVDSRCRGNTWFIPYETVQSSRVHPAQFPKALPLQCIKLHGVNLDEAPIKVMDPFMGVGTTAVACAELGVEFVGFELDEEYFAIARTAANAVTI